MEVTRITPSKVVVSHESGVVSILHEHLPAYQIAVPDQPSEVAPPPEPPAKLPPAWEPKSPDDVAGCSLMFKISEGLSGGGNQNGWDGSGFLCNVGGVTYIYTNVHNLDGAEKFEIADQNGIKYDDFDSVEVAADGQAFYEKENFGGDVARIRLKTFREKALTIDETPLDNTRDTGRKILVTGNTKGRGEITKLDGNITGIVPRQIIDHNAATQVGNSGSPIVDAETFRVIGILTWGSYDDTKPLSALWAQTPTTIRKGINTGAGLAGIKFVPSSFAILRDQRVVMNDLKRNTRVLGLLDAIEPTKKGLFTNPNVQVFGDYTVGEIIEESKGHPIIQELAKLDSLLAKRGESKIGMNNQDFLKLYIATQTKCLQMVRAHRASIENSKSATFYMKCQLVRSRVLVISKFYESAATRSLNWYIRQAGTSGDSMALRRVRFPSLPEAQKLLDAMEIKLGHEQ